jgi:uncharacterized protein (UPF0276 family)
VYWNRYQTPRFEHGLGLRHPHYRFILETKPKVGWFEAISENYFGFGECRGGRPLQVLKKIRSDYPVVLHGVSLSIGSTDPLNQTYLKQLKNLYAQIEPAWVSDHFCWTGVGGENVHDLLPLPHTFEVVRHLVERISEVQEFLGRPMLFENPSSYITFKSSELSEWVFISEVAKRSGCGILLDINNIYVNSVNHGFSALEYLKGVYSPAIQQFHLSGHSSFCAEIFAEILAEILIDTHDHPVSPPVWDLYRSALTLYGPRPTLLEWDDQIPEFPVLMNELERAIQIQEQQINGRSRSSLISAPTRSSLPSGASALAPMDHH